MKFVFALPAFVFLTSILPVSAQEPAQNNAARETLPVQKHLLLAPGEKNPRNSEGDFVQLKDGRLLFVYTHFTGGATDHANAHLASRESTNGGKTWSNEDKTILTNEAGMNVMSVSLLRLNSGQIALFYLRKNSTSDCRPILRLSNDETKSWSEPIELLPDDVGYYVLNNSRVIQLESGRLVVPLACHVEPGGKWQEGKIVVVLSDDNGKTWRRSATVLDKDDNGTRVNLMEPGVVEVEKNKILMLIRTKLGCQFASRSADGGETWETPRATDILSPESPATIRKIPSTGDLLLVWNDHTGKPEEVRRSRPPIRTPFAAAISRDGGTTWQKSKLIEDGPDHGYCYTAVTFVGERVLLGYCAHKSRWGLESTQISSFAIGELYR